MCGIAGAYQQRDGAHLAQVMNDRIAHRGPDAAGLRELRFGDSAVAHLAHRRLSIIDLSHAADQPLAKDGLFLSYNGELYNFVEIRDELVAKGISFTTQSDTEVVLEALRAWGPDALARFRGMFAIALFDSRDGSLLLARDPFGIKPLYVMERGDGVVFCSELKALVSAVGAELSVNRQALVASMLFYFLPETQNALLGVTKLTPGTWQLWRPDGTHTAGRFWDTVAQARAAAQQSHPAELNEVIESSVAAHMVADVPVASFLSGGLDSSLITAMAAKRDPSIEAYTITFRAQDHKLESMPDDALYARKMAQYLGIKLHEIEISPNVVELLPRMVDILDEPIGDPAAINTLLMCDTAREAGVKVMLSGMGADEFFGGYRKHLACLIASRYQQLPDPLRTKLIHPAVDRLPVMAAGRGIRTTRWAKRFLSFAELSEEEAFRRSYTLYDPEEITRLLGDGLGGEVDAVLAGHRAVYEGTGMGDAVNRMCLTDAQIFLPGLNLAYTDRSSMEASMEVRVPLVDPEVFKAAFTFTGKQKIVGRVQKKPLKDVARAWLPDEIIDRPKASFGAPLRAWVGNELAPMINDVLVNGELVNSGLLRRDELNVLIEDQRTGRRDESKQLWQLLSMELWYRNVTAAGVRGM